MSTIYGLDKKGVLHSVSQFYERTMDTLCGRHKIPMEWAFKEEYIMNTGVINCVEKCTCAKKCHKV